MLPVEDFEKEDGRLVNQRKKCFAEERAKARKKLNLLFYNDLKLQRLNTEEKGGKVKEEEPVKRVGKRKKQKARKGISIDKNPQGDSEIDKEESIEAMNPYFLLILKINILFIGFGAMLKDFPREDLIELYRLVMQNYGTNRPEDAMQEYCYGVISGLYTVMSASDESTVTYIEVSSPFEGLSNIGSPGVVGPEHKDEVIRRMMIMNDLTSKADMNDEEEEEHPTPADSTAVALLAADQAPSAEETEPFETDKFAATPPPHPAYCVTARISIPAPVPTPVWSDAEIAFTPLPLIPSPSLPLSPPLPVSAPPPASPIRLLGYQAAMIWLRAEAPSTSLSLLLPYTYHLTPPSGTPSPLPIPAFTSSPPLLLPSTSSREDRPEVTLPPRKRLGIALGPTYEVGESSSVVAARLARGLRVDYGFVATMDREIRRDLERDVGYGIIDTWDDMVEDLQGTPVVTEVVEINQRMAEFETRVRQDTNGVYTRLDDEQTERQLLAGRLNMLFRDRRAHVMSLRTTVLAQQSVITELQAADRRRQAAIIEMLAAYRRRQKQFTKALKLIKRLQTQMIEFERQHGPAKGPAQPDAPEEAGTVGNDIAYAMTWTELKKKMTDKYCPRIKIKKLEVERWELKVKGTDVIGYNQRFQELALLCGRMFPEESDKIKKYVGGLPDMIHRSVVASKPKTMQEAI
ncbi:reverse transcriptase domain-containing protein [Tanacetum coccineum]|uniref:Reverse transcriptase domain-containing protein n=1 Tax=Tanacetum coccineum TaxID=301880 RepID=A0ABQ5D7L5_9ASTR